MKKKLVATTIHLTIAITLRLKHMGIVEKFSKLETQHLKFESKINRNNKKKVGMRIKLNQGIGWCGSSGHSWPPKIEWCDHNWRWRESPLAGS